MPQIILLRHARPTSGWGEGADPGLDRLGVIQARAAAAHLSRTFTQSVPVFTSPLRRCRETVAALEESWSQPAVLFPPVAEMPSPPLDASGLRAWIQTVMRGSWGELRAHSPPGSPDYPAWRDALFDAVLTLKHDCIICTHFIAINVLVGKATDSEQVISFHPDYASITTLQSSNGELEVVALGREAQTQVAAR